MKHIHQVAETPASFGTRWPRPQHVQAICPSPPFCIPKDGSSPELCVHSPFFNLTNSFITFMGIP